MTDDARQLLVPNIKAFPINTELPFKIRITTKSAPLTRAKADEHPMGKPIFPELPVSYTEIQFRLNRWLRIQTQGIASTTSRTDVTCFLGDGMVASRVQPEVEMPEKEWEDITGTEKATTKEAKGRWVQRATYSMKLTFDVPPTFATDMIECKVSAACIKSRSPPHADSG